MPIQTNLFERENLFLYSDKVRLFDKDDETGLEMYSYTNCTNLDCDFVKNCRGLVYDGNSMIARSFSFTPEFCINDFSNEKNIELFNNLNDWTFFSSYEGAILRLFYFSGKWFLCTHHKLNAFRSKWSSNDSFGTLFKKALESFVLKNQNFKNSLPEGDTIFERFQNSLNKSYQYMFLVLNTEENRIVCHPPLEQNNLMFHVGTFHGDQFIEKEYVGLPYPETHNFKSFQEIINFVENANPMQIQGLVARNKNGDCVKILNSEYMDLSKVRGNEASLKFRYLQIRTDKDLTEKFYKLYPSMIREFNDYESCLFYIASAIYRAYVNRFIKKNYVTVPKEEYKVINECHSWHVSDRVRNKINIERVIYILNKQPATNLNHMIRRYKLEQLKKNETIPRTIVKSPQFENLNLNHVEETIEPLVLKV